MKAKQGFLGAMSAADHPILRTERLVLRKARPDDLAAIHAVLSNEEATRYWSTSAHETLAQSEEWLRSMIDAPSSLSHDFVVEHEGKVIGKAGCWQLPEIGIILHPDYWNRGLAREALQAAIRSTFASFPVEALTADVDPRNRASLRLFESLGFEQTGQAERTWFVNGEWADSVYFILHRDRLQSRFQ